MSKQSCKKNFKFANAKKGLFCKKTCYSYYQSKGLVQTDQLM